MSFENKAPELTYKIISNYKDAFYYVVMMLLYPWKNHFWNIFKIGILWNGVWAKLLLTSNLSDKIQFHFQTMIYPGTIGEEGKQIIKVCMGMDIYVTESWWNSKWNQV